MEGMVSHLKYLYMVANILDAAFFFCWLAKENLNGFFHSHQVTDLTLAKENQTSFEEYLSNTPNADPGIDLTVTVLTTGFWPSYKSFDLNLPAEMVIWIFLI